MLNKISNILLILIVLGIGWRVIEILTAANEPPTIEHTILSYSDNYQTLTITPPTDKYVYITEFRIEGNSPKIEFYEYDR